MTQVKSEDSVSTLVFCAIAALPLIGVAVGGPEVAVLCTVVAVVFLLSEKFGLGIDRDYVWTRWAAIVLSSLVIIVALYRLGMWVASQPDVLVAIGVVAFVVLGIAAALRNLITQVKLVDEYADQKDSDVR